MTWAQDFVIGRPHAGDFSFPFKSLTTLHCAAMLGQSRLEEWLLSLSCDSIDRMSPFGTPLQCAVIGPLAIDLLSYSFEDLHLGSFRLRSDNRKTMEPLLQAGADCTTPFRDLEHRYHSMFEVIFNTNLSKTQEAIPIIKLLLDNGAVLDMEALERLMDLHGCGYPEAINLFEIFSPEQCEPSAVNRFLEVAATLKSPASLRGLVHTPEPSNGSLVEPTRDTTNALHLAAQYDQTDTVLRLLENVDSDVNAVSGLSGDSALHAAASNGALRTIKALIESGADVNQANAHSETPLHVAALNRDSQIVTLLVHQGAEIGRVDNEGLTALDVAAIDNSCDVLNSLLGGNAFSEVGTTLEPACIVSALFNAVKNESEDALLLLAQKHPASDLRFKGGLTLLHYCNALSLEPFRYCLGKTTI